MTVTPETREKVLALYGCRCYECGGSADVEIHHKLPRSKYRIKCYPLFIDSILNLIPLCGGFGKGCHEKTKHIHKVTDREAAAYEEFLRELREGR